MNSALSYCDRGMLAIGGLLKRNVEKYEFKLLYGRFNVIFITGDNFFIFFKFSEFRRDLGIERKLGHEFLIYVFRSS